MKMYLVIPQMYDQYHKFMDTFADLTSKEVWRATQTLGKLFANDIDILLGSTQRQFEVYKLCYDGTQNLLSRLMDEFESHVLYTEQLLYLSRTEGVRHPKLKASLEHASSDLETILETLDLMLAKFRNASIAVDSIGVVHEKDIGLLPAKFFMDEEICNTTVQDLAQSLETLGILYKDLNQFEDATSADEIAELSSRLSSNASRFIGLWDRSQDCFTEYRELLKNALALSATIKSRVVREVIELDSPIGMDTSMAAGMLKMAMDHNRIDLAIKSYILNVISKQQLLASFVSVDGSQGQVHIHVSTLTNNIRTRMITPLSSILLTLRLDLQRDYLSAMQKASTLQSYLHAGFFYDRAVKMAIWQVPKSDPIDPKAYITEGRELWRIWDRDISIAHFTKKAAPAIITEALASFIDPLQDEVINADAQLSLKNQDLVVAIERVQEEFVKYQLQRTIDHELVL